MLLRRGRGWWRFCRSRGWGRFWGPGGSRCFWWGEWAICFSDLLRVISRLRDTAVVGLRVELCRGSARDVVGRLGWAGGGEIYRGFLILGPLPSAGCVASWGTPLPLGYGPKSVGGSARDVPGGYPAFCLLRGAGDLLFWLFLETKKADPGGSAFFGSICLWVSRGVRRRSSCVRNRGPQSCTSGERRA